MAKKFSIKKVAAGVLAALMVVTALPVSGISASTAKAAESDTVKVYRSYNPNSGEHLFTIDKSEHETVVSDGRDDEGVRWLAPATSKTPIYRSYNPNTGEHLLVPQKEAEWLATQGWTNEGIKMYSDDNKTEGIYRLYNANAINTKYPAASHTYTGDKEEAEWLVAQGWTYDNGGDPVIYAVELIEEEENPDLSGVVTLVDVDGLQTDGTALIGDKLSIVYGADFGTPYAITWYMNGIAVTTTLITDTSNLATAGYNLTTATAGTVFAVVENTLHERYYTDSIKVAEDELPVDILDFEIVDDYGDPANGVDPQLSYAATDQKAVAKVTISKDVAGTFYVYPAETVRYASDTGVASEKEITATQTATTTTANAEARLAKLSDLTAKNAITAAYNSGGAGSIEFMNADGSVTYMFALNNTTGIKRGSDYKIALSQTNCKKTAISSTARTDVMTSEDTTAPYLEAPGSIAVTKRAAGSAPEITVYDEDEEILSWYGVKAGTEKVSALGATAFKVYECTGTSKTSGIASTVGTDSTSKLGVITGDKALSASGYSYYYAELSLDKGIFGEKAITLTSEVVEGATPIADKVDVFEDTTSPTTAVVKLSNVRSDATVFIVNGTNGTAELSAFKYNDPTTYVTYGTVSKGDTELKIENAIKKFDSAKTFYSAIVVPSDMENYTQVTTGKDNTNKAMSSVDTNAGTGDCLELSQVQTTYGLAVEVKDIDTADIEKSVNKGGTISKTPAEATANLVKIYDQFGTEFVVDGNGQYTQANVTNTAWNLTTTDSTDNGITGVKVSLTKNLGTGSSSKAWTGVEVSVTGTAGEVGQTWTGKTAQGQTITAKVSTDKKWTITIE